MNREELLSYSIAGLFLVGVLAFFVYMPSDLKNLQNFLGYISSLSTAVMVLVYLLTTTRQLSAMNKQLDEMQFSRKIQYQPLLSLEKCEVRIYLPRYYVGPRTEFTEMKLITRLFFDSSVINIGNGPALSIIFMPFITSRNGDILVESHGERVECISLKEGTSEEITFLFLDDDNKLIEHLLDHSILKLNVSIIYKNSLSLAFEQKMSFYIQIDKVKDLMDFKTSMKIIKTADLDYGARVSRYKSLIEKEKDEEADTILSDINEDINTKLIKDTIEMSPRLVPGSFKIESLNDSDYDEKVSQYEEIVKKILNMPE